MSTKSSTPAKSTPRPSARRRLRADRNGVLIAASIMAGGGWVLLYRLVVTAKPFAFPPWVVFILLFFAVTGAALAVVWFLNHGFYPACLGPGGTFLRPGTSVC